MNFQSHFIKFQEIFFVVLLAAILETLPFLDNGCVEQE